jgi:hypothetical protein
MSRRSTPYWTAAVLLLATTGSRAVRGEVILGPSQNGTDATPYFRFSGGYPADPTTTVNNPTFNQSALDFSGVGWRLPGIIPGTAWNVTMIDSTHFISNWHLHTTNVLNVGDTINFRPAGTSSIVTRTVTNLQQVSNLGFAAQGVPDGSPSDVLLGTLDSAVGPGIAAYPIASAVTASVGQTVLMYGRESAVGRNNISPNGPGSPSPLIGATVGTGTTIAFRMDYDQPNSNPDGISSLLGNDEAHFNAGDSGGPTFAVVGGQLQLVGGNMFVQSYGDVGEPPLPPGVADATEYSGSTYLPAYVVQINALIAVPEPSGLAFATAAVAGAFGCVRARRRRAT